MVRFRVSDGRGRTLLALFLDRGNVDRLTNRQPIHFHLEEMGVPGYDLLIGFGETQDDIVEKLRELGVEVPSDLANPRKRHDA
jgi:hypothetical protein